MTHIPADLSVLRAFAHCRRAHIEQSFWPRGRRLCRSRAAPAKCQLRARPRSAWGEVGFVVS
eukprot:1966317-Pyramimonas_sp.AAC.1